MSFLLKYAENRGSHSCLDIFVASLICLIITLEKITWQGSVKNSRMLNVADIGTSVGHQQWCYNLLGRNPLLFKKYLIVHSAKYYNKKANKNYLIRKENVSIPVVTGSGVLFALCWNQSELLVLYLGEVLFGFDGGGLSTIFKRPGSQLRVE